MKNISRLKQLFTCIENKENKSLSFVFSELAKSWNLKKNSVRNMYYLALKKAQSDSNFANCLNAHINKIKNYKIVPFTNSELKNLVEFVDEKIKNGYSIRKACIELSNNNANLMQRYQNKYRSIKKKQIISDYKKVLVLNNKNVNKNKNKNTNKENNIALPMQMPNNVIPFKKKESHLSDKELQSLFFGLVRIVKSSAVAEVSNALKDQCNMQAIEIRNLIKKMTALKDELDETQRQNSKLKKELEFVKMDKVNNYAMFLEKLKQTNNSKENLKK